MSLFWTHIYIYRIKRKPNKCHIDDFLYYAFLPATHCFCAAAQKLLYNLNKNICWRNRDKGVRSMGHNSANTDRRGSRLLATGHWMILLQLILTGSHDPLSYKGIRCRVRMFSTIFYSTAVVNGPCIKQCLLKIFCWRSRPECRICPK